MKAEQKDIFSIELNNANPRRIIDRKFKMLVNSLLAMPKMLNLRPLVLDRSVVLGGNMRLKALQHIAKMEDSELLARFSTIKELKNRPAKDIEALKEWWLSWKDKPYVPTLQASELSDAEKEAFIIKDNASFGDWDYTYLISEWDAGQLGEWGVDTWGAIDDEEKLFNVKKSSLDDFLRTKPNEGINLIGTGEPEQPVDNFEGIDTGDSNAVINQIFDDGNSGNEKALAEMGVNREEIISLKIQMTKREYIFVCLELGKINEDYTKALLQVLGYKENGDTGEK